MLKKVRKLKGETSLASAAPTVIVVLVVLTIGVLIVGLVNQTAPVHLGISVYEVFKVVNPAVFALIGVALMGLKTQKIRKLKGETNLVNAALTVIIVLVVLTIGMFIVQQVNQTTPVRLGINVSTVFTLIGVSLIVMVAGVIIWHLRNSLGGGGV